jgi:hypothetical protein
MNAPWKALLTGLLLLCLCGAPAAALCGELPAQPAAETTAAPDTEQEVQPDALAEPEEARYTFEYGIEAFDRRLQAIFEALGASYEMGEEPNIQGAYEYHFPHNVYAKTLLYEEKIEYVILFLPMENSADQGALWQYAAYMAAAAGDISAADWAQLLLKASSLTLDTVETDLWFFAAGNTIVICQTDPEAEILYVIIEREEYERDEPMDGSFQTS